MKSMKQFPLHKITEITGLLHRLNLCRTVEGRTIRLWIDAKEWTVGCREQAEEEA